MRKKLLLFIISSAVGLLVAIGVKAVCPVCTIAVGAGIGLAQWLGIDDTITGLWIGGLCVSLIMWTMIWLAKKSIKFRGLAILTTLGYYLLIILPLFWKGILGHPLNKIWGIDRLLLGIIIGSIVFAGFAFLHNYVKKENNGKSYFPMQKVAFPIAPLIILSVVFYFIF